LACCTCIYYNGHHLYCQSTVLFVCIPFVVKQCIHKTENLFWLLIIVLPLSTEINITPSLGIDLPDELVLMLLTILIIAKTVYTPFFFPKAVLQHPLFLVVVLQLLWAMVCTIFSVNNLLSFKYCLAKVWYIIPFLVLPQLVLTNKESFKKLCLCFLVPMFLVVVQCLFRHSLTGFSFEGIKESLSPFFRNHVNYSAMLVCLLVMLACAKNLTVQQSAYKKWINIGLMIGLVALFFAYSRGAWLALFAGIFSVFIFRKKLMAKALVICVVGLFVMVGWLGNNNHYLRFSPNFEQTIFHDDLGEHLKSTTTLKDLSNAERFYRWVAGAKMFIDKPLTGFGPNTFYSNYKNYTVSQFKTSVSDNPEHSSVHNYFLLVALEQGIIGLFLFCALVFGMLMQSQRLYHNLKDTFYKKVSLATGVIIVMILIINCTSDMIETDKIGSLFWLCLGVLILLSNKQKVEQEKLVV
jgi:O-antigen ligase